MPSRYSRARRLQSQRGREQLRIVRRKPRRKNGGRDHQRKADGGGGDDRRRGQESEPRPEWRGDRDRGFGKGFDRHQYLNPGIEQGVGDVDQEIDGDVDARGQKDHRLNDGIIAREHGIDGEAADAGQVEHAFGDDHARYQQRKTGADHGDDRHRGVAQRMTQQHAALGNALGARGADIILAEHVEHRRAGHARDQRDVDERQRAGRQDESLEVGAEAVIDAAIALHRQPAQVDGEDLDQHITDHEHRHREADHRQPHHEAVDPAAVLPRRDDAKRHRDHDGEDDGRHRDRDRRLDALADHLQHRHVRDQRHAEIAVQQLADPGEELGVERLVQPERGADALQLLRRSIIAGENRGGIARRQPQQQEHEQRHHAHHGDGGEHAAEQVA